MSEQWGYWKCPRCGTINNFYDSAVIERELGAKQLCQSCTEPRPLMTSQADPVSHPPHYTSHPSGVECIQVTEHMSFCVGNAIKYLWRADLKSDPIEDLRKARWYIDREIERRTK